MCHIMPGQSRHALTNYCKSTACVSSCLIRHAVKQHADAIEHMLQDTDKVEPCCSVSCSGKGTTDRVCNGVRGLHILWQHGTHVLLVPSWSYNCCTLVLLIYRDCR